MTFYRQFLPIFLIAPLFLSAGCKRAATEITVRQLSEQERDLKITKSSAERFRMTGMMKAARKTASKPKSEARLVYKTPKGWKEVPGSQMRNINMKFGKDGKGECYLTKLAGAGGGMLANVNRWRKQMGAPPLTQAQVDALPKKPLFGNPATVVDVTGNFGGMSGSAGKKNYRLLGLILVNQYGAIFVKMIGPKADVDANTAQFDEFTSSINLTQGQ